MTTLKLIAPEVALQEACSKNTLAKFTTRQQELIRWLADYLLNLPGKLGGTLLGECISQVQELGSDTPIVAFGIALLQPVGVLRSYVAFDQRAWDYYALPLGDWYRKGIREVRLVSNAELVGSHDDLLGFVLLNRALSFDEIASVDPSDFPLRETVF